MIFLKTLDSSKEITSGTEECTEQDFFSAFRKSKVQDKYIQIAAGFDIEASSFKLNDKKLATMYIWQMAFLFNLNSTEIYYIYGRTWNEWENLIYLLRKYTNNKQKLIIYVHNLSYEFQWIYTHLYFTKVFARKSRHPIYVESDNIIFKCSYMLSNYSLRNLAKERGYTLKEDMNYDLIRTSSTPLTKKEINYSLTDVKILCEYIADEIKRNGTIQNIPLTSTGYARRYCLDFIKENENFIKYQKAIQYILPIEEELFKLLFQAYTGAFTHANISKVGYTLENVFCKDFTSSYPAVMCRKKFPMKFHKADPDRMEFYKGKAMVMKITFNNIETTTNHTILSSHKCITENAKIDNGRIISASKLTTVITDLDYDIISKFYKWEVSHIETLYIADYRYLPRSLILAILHLYSNKTTLKGVIGKEEAYLRSKELINSVYGMSVTNPLNDEITFDINNGEWGTESTSVTDGLQKYYNNRNVFTAYQWGVWVTAWARWELLNTVYDIGDDVIYCDTDSIKNINNHEQSYEKVNKRILKENDEIIKHERFDSSFYNPKTIEGEVKTLGLWDSEPMYKYFKTLGAKRYCYSYQDDYFNKKKDKLKTNDNFFITVAGLGKDAGKQAILRKAYKYHQSPYDIFAYENDEISSTYQLEISEEESGKMCFSYQNETFSAEVMDYKGNISRVYESSYVYSEHIPFKFNATDEFLSLLKLYSFEMKKGGTFNQLKLKLKEN